MTDRLNPDPVFLSVLRDVSEKRNFPLTFSAELIDSFASRLMISSSTFVATMDVTNEIMTSDDPALALWVISSINSTYCTMRTIKKG
jgi:hypothetical protein